ncbi:MAG TPA: AraC family transcriptional regulator [Terriglobales bacterium]|nr:AraC family transcriptional regulator [Terriglobales bacterium]
MLDHDTYARLCRARDFLAAHYARRLTLDEAAEVACLSPFHFHRLFSSAFGETPLHFQTRLRIREAKHRLILDNDPVTDICFDLGYESLGSFSSRFRRLVGHSPLHFRRNIRRRFFVPALWRLQTLPYCFVQFYGLEKPQD